MAEPSTISPFSSQVWVQAHGQRFRVLTRAGTGGAIVLLHGAAQNALWWNQLARFLAGRPITALDLPGHGLSPAPPCWALADMAERVHAAVTAAIPGRLVWAGQSLGGKLAALIAAAHPENCAGLVLVDPSPAGALPVRVEEFVDAAWCQELGPWKTVEEAVCEASTLTQYRAWNPHVEAAFLRGLVHRREGWRARVSRTSLIACTRETLLVDHSPRIGAVDVPTLLIVAKESLAWQHPTNMSLMQRATMHVLSGSHWLHVECPGEVASQMSAWMDELDAGAAA